MFNKELFTVPDFLFIGVVVTLWIVAFRRWVEPRLGNPVTK